MSIYEKADQAPYFVLTENLRVNYIYKENFKRHLLLNHQWEFVQTSQE